ncbi:MAG: ATP-binding protein [Clostridiales bacterium]|jgi:hypothetical protein|nr:ATP-binding protein [Clostridiales bacterium]
MMKEFSMHIADIAQNSVRAGATKIDVVVEENSVTDVFLFSVKDNGCGMTQETLKKVRDPFTTSRTTRKVGLGIPMLEQTCIQCGGKLLLESELGKGTYIEATMSLADIDRPPLGDVAGAIQLLIISNLETRITYTHKIDGKEFSIDTDELNETLDGVPLNEPEVALWIRDAINEGIAEMR